MNRRRLNLKIANCVHKKQTVRTYNCAAYFDYSKAQDMSVISHYILLVTISTSGLRHDM